jgi:PPOX class probable F420-dependent enzyme
MSDALAQFEKAKYLSLETFRKTGVGVKTPVWFAQKPGQLMYYVYAEADSGKVKRIRNNSKVRIVPCSMRGEVKSEWVEAWARICSGDEVTLGQQLLRQKYGWQKRIGDFFSRLFGHKQAVLVIEIG